MRKLYNKQVVMNIGIIGSGGRENAICKKISESKKIKKFLPSRQPWHCKNGN